MAKSLLKKNEFADHVAFEFVKIPAVDLPMQSGSSPEEEAQEAFHLEMEQKKEQLQAELSAQRTQMQEKIEKERIELLEASQKEAQVLLQEAKKLIEDRDREANERVSSLLEEAQKEKEALLEEARLKKEELIAEGQESVEKVHQEAYDLGYDKGFKEAYDQANRHLDALFANIQSIADHLLARRQQILSETQGQITAVLLSVIRKIIYKLSDSQENLVLKTIQEALLRITTHTDIILRVNPANFSLVQEWKETLKERFKNLKSVQVFEDSSIEKGGCLVETDFGEIDARIATQISRLEEKILEMNPILMN